MRKWRDYWHPLVQQPSQVVGIGLTSSVKNPYTEIKWKYRYRHRFVAWKLKSFVKKKRFSLSKQKIFSQHFSKSMTKSLSQVHFDCTVFFHSRLPSSKYLSTVMLKCDERWQTTTSWLYRCWSYLMIGRGCISLTPLSGFPSFFNGSGSSEYSSRRLRRYSWSWLLMYGENSAKMKQSNLKQKQIYQRWKVSSSVWIYRSIGS